MRQAQQKQESNMKLHVKFELGADDDVADDAKETGIMIGTTFVESVSPFVPPVDAAIIVMRSGKVFVRPLSEVEVIDKEIMDMLDGIVERAEELGLPAPDVD